TCPTTSIKFGNQSEMVESAVERVTTMHAQGSTEARLYGANTNDGVGGIGSVFLLLDEPEVYGLPPDPQVPTKELPQMYKKVGIAAAGMLAAAATAFVGARKKCPCLTSTHLGPRMRPAAKRNVTVPPVMDDGAVAAGAMVPVKCRWSTTSNSATPTMAVPLLSPHRGTGKSPRTSLPVE